MYDFPRGGGTVQPMTLWILSFAPHPPLPDWSRNRSQALSSEASVDEGGVFESLKAEAASPPALFSGLSGLPAGSLPTTPFPSSLVLGAAAGGGDVFLQMPASREESGGRGEGGAYHHHRQPHHHFHHGSHRGGSLLQHVGGDHRSHSEAVICWLQKGLPFILILLAKLCFQHKLGECRGDAGVNACHLTQGVGGLHPKCQGQAVEVLMVQSPLKARIPLQTWVQILVD